MSLSAAATQEGKFVLGQVAPALMCRRVRAEGCSGPASGGRLGVAGVEQCLTALFAAGLWVCLPAPHSSAAISPPSLPASCQPASQQPSGLACCSELPRLPEDFFERMPVARLLWFSSVFAYHPHRCCRRSIQQLQGMDGNSSVAKIPAQLNTRDETPQRGAAGRQRLSYIFMLF